jgi:hypothetical protein
VADEPAVTNVSAIDHAVAVVIEQITGFLAWQSGFAERVFGAKVGFAAAHAKATGRRGALIDLAIAVVVRAVAHFGTARVTLGIGVGTIAVFQCVPGGRCTIDRSSGRFDAEAISVEISIECLSETAHDLA